MVAIASLADNIAWDGTTTTATAAVAFGPPPSYLEMLLWLSSPSTLATEADRHRISQLPLWRVCYGGAFAATRASIRQTSAASWRSLAASLERGDNIEEGHFMERTWAALLSEPPSSSTGEALRQAASCVIQDRPWQGFLGTLGNCRCR